MGNTLKRATPSCAALGLAALALAAAPGCSQHVYVLGVPSPGHEQAVAAGASFHIRSTTPDEDTERGAEIVRKTTLLLEEQGYRVAPEAEADYFLFFEYTIDTLLGTKRFQPISGALSGIETARRRGPFDHHLSLWIVDGDTYRQDGTEEVLWLGGAAISHAPTAGGRFLDMMLVRAFRHFNADTGDTLKLRTRMNDPRVRRLR